MGKFREGGGEVANFWPFSTAKNVEFWATAQGRIRPSDGCERAFGQRQQQRAAAQSVRRSRRDRATHNKDDAVRRFHGLSAN